MIATRGFALKLIPLFLISSWLLHRHHPGVALPWAGFGLSVVILGLVQPKALTPLHRLFSAMGRAMRSAMTRMVLELVYALVVTPLAWVARRIGKTFLDLEIDHNRESYFIRKSPEKTSAQDFEKAY